MGRPATGQTPVHTVRVPDPIWDAAEARVGKGNMSRLIVALLDHDNTAARLPAAPRRPAEIPTVPAAELALADCWTALRSLDDADYTRLKRAATDRCGTTDPDVIGPVMYQTAVAAGLL